MLVGLVNPATGPLVGAMVLGSPICFNIPMIIEITNGNFLGAALNGVSGVLLGLVPGLACTVQVFAQGMGVGDRRPHRRLALRARRRGLLRVRRSLLHCERRGGMDLVLLRLVFLYVGTAMLFATMFGRPMLPLGGPLFKGAPRPMAGEPVSAVDPG